VKYPFLLLFLLFLSSGLNAQNSVKDSANIGFFIRDRDTVFKDTILLEEVVIFKGKVNMVAVQEFELLKNRVYKTYPYAKLASERLVALNNGMAILKTTKDKNKYIKIIENYLNEEFKEQLKKLSRKQGQILIKLIHRQTGSSTYDLVKSLKSGWTAFWSSTTARMFDLNLRAEYSPYDVNEDYLIETILVRAFESHRLVNQPCAAPVNYEDLTNFWLKKAAKEENN
jgi:hypothetical protein